MIKLDKNKAYDLRGLNHEQLKEISKTTNLYCLLNDSDEDIVYYLHDDDCWIWNMQNNPIGDREIIKAKTLF